MKMFRFALTTWVVLFATACSAQTATKADVKAAVEQLFSVEVQSVNVVNMKGKARSFRFRSGTRGSKRKAYVRLAEGHTIDVSAKA